MVTTEMMEQLVRPDQQARREPPEQRGLLARWVRRVTMANRVSLARWGHRVKPGLPELREHKETLERPEQQGLWGRRDMTASKVKLDCLSLV